MSQTCCALIAFDAELGAAVTLKFYSIPDTIWNRISAVNMLSEELTKLRKTERVKTLYETSVL